MSKARPVYPSSVLFITRRVHRRQFLLRPSKKLNQILAYIIAVVAARYEIRLHALCVMSNHWHAVLTDVKGHIVHFERDCHNLITRAVNAMYGEFESIWAREPSCRIDCTDADSVLDKIAYTMANPVEARLVAHGKNWPGLRAAWPSPPRRIRRPDVFFRNEDEGGALPEEIDLVFYRPPRHGDLGDRELARRLEIAIEQREAQFRSQARQEGTRFLGRAGVLKQSRKSYPTSGEPRFRLLPRIAGRSRWVRIEVLERSAAWLEAYEDAKARFLAGDRSTRFPFGTWKLRVYYRCVCDPPPRTAPAAA